MSNYFIDQYNINNNKHTMDGTAFENQPTRIDPIDNISIFSNKNMLIAALLFLLVLSFLGINLLNIFGNIIQNIASTGGPFVAKILSIFGYATGSVIDKTAEVVGDTAIFGVDVAQDSIQDVGNLLKLASVSTIDKTIQGNLDNALRISPTTLNAAQPDHPESAIQKPITANKTSWCLVGEYQGKRGCVEVSEQDKCLSGQVFPQQKMCLNPNLSPNV